jgi:hypothetical protein
VEAHPSPAEGGAASAIQSRYRGARALGAAQQGRIDLENTRAALRTKTAEAATSAEQVAALFLGGGSAVAPPHLSSAAPPWKALSEIIPGRLYISAFARAPYREKTGKAVRRAAASLRAAGIGAIINMCGDSGRPMKPPPDFKYMHARGLRDSPSSKHAEKLRQCIPGAIEFVRNAWRPKRLSGGRLGVHGSEPRLGVLVHCREGKSRSASVAVALLCALDPSLTVAAAIERLQAARPICCPNDGFVAALVAWRREGSARGGHGGALLTL